MWGNYVDNELDQVEGKNSKEVSGRRQTLLHRLLEGNPETAKYATPVATTR